MPAHPGTAGPSRARGGLGVHTLGALQLRGGAPGGQTQPYLSWRSPDGQLGGGGGGGVANFPGSPFTRPALGMGGWAGGRGAPRTGQTCGTRGPGCLRSPSHGESRLFRGWDGCGRRDASVFMKTHKYRSSTGGRRRARGQVASTRVSRGPGGRPPPQHPASGLTAAPDFAPAGPRVAGDRTGAGGAGLGRWGMGVHVRNWARLVEMGPGIGVTQGVWNAGVGAEGKGLLPVGGNSGRSRVGGN